MTHTNSPTRFSGWLRHALANSPFLYRVNIHRRLTLCFIFVIVLMLVGNGVLLWQLHLIRVQVERLNGVNEELIEVLRVHTGLLSVYERLGVLARSEDSARLLKESATLRKGLLDDAQRTLAAFNHLPPEMKVDQTVLPTLESIELTLPSHLDAITAAAASGEWDAVRFRIERQVQPLESLSSELVKDVTREVEEQRAQAVLNISRAERRIFLAVPITGFVTLLIAAGLGVAITRSITEPLGRVVEGSKALARGEFENQISVIGTDELAHLGLVFNDTARKLRDLYEDLRGREEKLRCSEADLLEGQRLTHTLTWKYDVSSRKVTNTPEANRIYGFKGDEDTSDPELYFEMIHPDDRKRVRELFERCTVLKVNYEADYAIILPDGNIRHIHATGHPVLNELGDLVEWIGTTMDITERKQREEALRRSEGYLAEAQKLTHTGSWAVQVPQMENAQREAGQELSVLPRFGWNSSYWSKEMYQIFGFDPDPTPPSYMEVAQRLHPEDARYYTRVVEKAIRDRTDFEADYRLLLPNGAAKYIHVVGHPVVNASGDVIEFVGTAMDVTEQHEARAALQTAFEQIKAEQTELRRSEADLHEAQRLSHTGSWKHNVSSGEVTVSPEVYRIFGVTADEDASAVEFWLNRNHPEDGKRIRELFERSEIQKTDYQADYRIVLPGGAVKYLHASGHPVLNDSGDLVEFVGTVMDVTAAKQAEEKIRQSERELRQLIDLTPLHITEFGPDGTPLYNNQAALNYHGLTLEEWRSADLDRLFHPQDAERMRREQAAKFRGGSPYEFEVRLRRKDGQYRWFAFRYNPVRDEQGHLKRWYAAASDIEDRKQAEQRLQDENVVLREEIDKAFMFEEIVGSSPALQTVLSSIMKVAPTDSTVLITGETGTGKELIARAIHKHSQRSGQAFISVNCASIPSSLIASELFGHEKGAFTGAVQRRQGRFEMAHSGTIFLDEVGELPAETQIALLRVLQERQFERVGGNRILSTDVRVIAATNRDLTATIAAGTFRADLFYRLNVFPIEVPPLRKRREDIPMLVEYFVKRYAEKAGKQIRKIDRNTLEQCQSYPWPGNIRELQNIVERSVILSGGDTFWIEKAWLTGAQPPGQELAGPLPDTLQNQERKIIETALTQSKGKVAGPEGAAAKLGIPRSTLDSKIRQLRIKKHRFIPE